MVETTGNRKMQVHTTGKPFNITKKQVYEAYKAVKSNAGSAGVDGQTIEQFDSDLRSNLYKLWNRMRTRGATFHRRCVPSPFPKRLEASGFLGVAYRSGSCSPDGCQNNLLSRTWIQSFWRTHMAIGRENRGARCYRRHAEAVLEIRFGF